MAITRLQEYLTNISEAKRVTAISLSANGSDSFFKRNYNKAWKYVDLAISLDEAAMRGWKQLHELQKINNTATIFSHKKRISNLPSRFQMRED